MSSRSATPGTSPPTGWGTGSTARRASPTRCRGCGVSRPPAPRPSWPVTRSRTPRRSRPPSGSVPPPPGTSRSRRATTRAASSTRSAISRSSTHRRCSPPRSASSSSPPRRPAWRACCSSRRGDWSRPARRSRSPSPATASRTSTPRWDSTISRPPWSRRTSLRRRRPSACEDPEQPGLRERPGDLRGPRPGLRRARPRPGPLRRPERRDEHRRGRERRAGGGRPLGGRRRGTHRRARRPKDPHPLPPRPGLAPSAAATLAGPLLARGMISAPQALDARTVLHLAAEFEGHPDNAAPALLGGVALPWMQGADARAVPLRVAEGALRPVVLLPTATLSTDTARGLLPEGVPYSEAIFNASRSALLVHALADAPELLLEATEDRLHQDRRAPSMPESVELMRVLRREGHPSVVSGAGPAVLVMAGRRAELAPL